MQDRRVNACLPKRLAQAGINGCRRLFSVFKGNVLATTKITNEIAHILILSAFVSSWQKGTTYQIKTPGVDPVFSSLKNLRSGAVKNSSLQF